MPDPQAPRILIIDDEPPIRKLLRLGLQALQSLSSAELHDRIRALRLPGKPAK